MLAKPAGAEAAGAAVVDKGRVVEDEVVFRCRIFVCGNR
jgi:hypothetical protein